MFDSGRMLGNSAVPMLEGGREGNGFSGDVVEGIHGGEIDLCLKYLENKEETQGGLVTKRNRENRLRLTIE